jgi:hypothetical protein
VSELAIVALLVIAYTYAGYPLLIAGLAAFRARPPRASSAYEPSVSICVAICNGVRYLQAKLESVRSLDYPADKIEIPATVSRVPSTGSERRRAARS